MFTLNNRGLVYVGCGFLFVGFLVSWLVLVGWFFFTFFFFLLKECLKTLLFI